jgi:hypothetical protein
MLPVQPAPATVSASAARETYLAIIDERLSAADHCRGLSGAAKQWVPNPDPSSNSTRSSLFRNAGTITQYPQASFLLTTESTLRRGSRIEKGSRSNPAADARVPVLARIHASLPGADRRIHSLSPRRQAIDVFMHWQGLAGAFALSVASLQACGGRSEQPGGFAGSSARGPSGAAGLGGDCDSAVFSFRQSTPNVMLVVDRSGSMKTDFAGAGARWNVLRDALIDPANGFIAVLEKKVRFGITLFTASLELGPFGFPSGTGGSGGTGGGSGAAGKSSAGSGVSLGDPGACPWLVEVPIALDNLATISSVYEADDWQGATPTAEALSLVWPKLRDIDQTTMPGPNYIILATDGEPNGCADFMTDGRPGVLDAVSAAHLANITTYVISVGEDVGRDHLRQVANVGQGKPIDSPDDLFYVAGNTQELVDALNAIMVGLPPCDFDLGGTVDLDQAQHGDVVIDGTRIPYDDPDGWELVTDEHIKFNGKSCDLVRNGATRIQVDFPCGAFTLD